MCAEQARPGRADNRVGRTGIVPADFPTVIAASFPEATIDVDRPLRDDGEWWFDIGLGGREIHVSWQAARGFGVYLGEPGYGERPSEIYADPRMAARRVLQIARGVNAGVEPAAMGMGQVRRLLGHTQADIAAALRIGQANVSRLEGRANPTLGSMRALVEAMGGQLEVRARFPEIDVPIALPAPEAEG